MRSRVHFLVRFKSVRFRGFMRQTRPWVAYAVRVVDAVAVQNPFPFGPASSNQVTKRPRAPSADP